MVAQWATEVVGEMKQNKITRIELAKEAGMNPKYVGMILNGRRNPKHGEAVLRFALEKAIEKKGDG